MKLIVKLSELNLPSILSTPSPLLRLLTDNCIASLEIEIFKPSFRSAETVVTLSIEFLNSFNFISKILLLSLGITLL